MLELGHHLGLLDEVVLGHGALLHHLHCRIDGSAPFAAPHYAKLSRSQLLHQHQLHGMNLPFVVGQASRRWNWAIAGRGFESAGQAARVVAMVVDQIRNCLTAVLLAQIILAAGILLDVVVLHMRLWTVVGP